MDPKPLKLPIHDHPLFPTVNYFNVKCGGCHAHNNKYCAYFCNEPTCSDWLFHKECGEAPLEINHGTHPQHTLLLTNDSSGDSPCDLCGQKLLPPCYSCPTCQFKVDLTCGMKPSPPTIEHPMCHEHPLVFLKKGEEKEVPCELCKDSIGGPSYSCLVCCVYFHVDCVHLSKELNYPCHSSHPLKFIASDTLTNDAETSCFICARQPENVVYHCSICNFTACVSCTKIPPPLVIEHTKTHKHPLTLFSRRISSTCDVCGKEDNAWRYICHQCDFLIHALCIGLPRVININRHDHRISFTDHLGAGYSKCGVCHQYMSQYKGAYSCSVCPNFAVHSRCAFEAWDFIDYEGIPEITEDIAPFKVVGDNLICHFSHEKHPLKFHKEDVIHDEHIRCEACIHPVGFGSIYVCDECCFFLHEKCANLPMKKKCAFFPFNFTLESVCQIILCGFCGILSNGFKYRQHGGVVIDVHCGSLSEPFVHDGHIHPLYFNKKKGKYCNGCRKDVNGDVLRCDACEFHLCFRCASLPEKTWYRNDWHPLTLCCDGKASGKNWCDICERELDLSEWFYICSKCGVTLHAQCVLGDFSCLMPGKIHYLEEKRMEVVLNNHNTRPLCSQCHSRCKASVILKDFHEENEYICSFLCLVRFVGWEELYNVDSSKVALRMDIGIEKVWESLGFTYENTSLVL